MSDLFPSITPKEIQERSCQRAGELLDDVQKILSNISMFPLLPRLEEVSKELAEINARIEELKQKIN